MVFTYPQFDVIIERRVTPARLSWPEPGEAMNERSLGCNRSYIDLRRLTWMEARRVYSVEGEYITRIETSADPEKEYDLIEDELYDDPDGVYGLDIGVASTVVALSAARCIPFSSCNGGAFGGSHHESHPVVAFFSRHQTAPLLLECAEKTNSGLELGSIGNLIVYADDIRNIRAFARTLIARSSTFRRLRFSKGRGKESELTSQQQYQLELF